jgi:hypothetical protein
LQHRRADRRRGEIVWACFPRFDGDAMFCSLLRERDGNEDFGFMAVDLADFSHAEQEYLTNTAILVTRLYDGHGGAVESPTSRRASVQHGRMFAPMTLVRQLRRLVRQPAHRAARAPGPRLRPQPSGRHLGQQPHPLRHARPHVLRLTTDASITAVLEETPFFLEDTRHADPRAGRDPAGRGGRTGRRFAEETAAYWREWVRYLAIPFEWQEAVIRAAITLKLNAYDDTGAIVAAMTTSIPEAAGSGATGTTATAGCATAISW